MMSTDVSSPRGDGPTGRDDRPARPAGELSAAAALLEALAGDPSPAPAGRDAGQDASAPAEALSPVGWEGRGLGVRRSRPARPAVPATETEARKMRAHRSPANVSVPREANRAVAAPPSAAPPASPPTSQAGGPTVSASGPAALSASRAQAAPPASLDTRPTSMPAAAPSASRTVTLHVNQLYVQSPAELAELAADARHRAGIDL
jgi:hypothetical protein